MKKILNTIFLATLLFAAGCSEYDDSRIKKDLDDVEQRLEELEEILDGMRSQMNALTALINSSFVSLISTDAAGNYVITYIDRGGESHTITLATQKEVVTLPIVGIAKDEDGEWYWRQTSDNGATYEWILVDGKKLPVAGEKPEVGIDADGYWTVNGVPLTDAQGNKILANDVSNILFREAYVDQDTGEAVFVLADGTELRLQMFEALSIAFDSSVYTAIADYTTKVKIKYTVGGSQSAGSVVDIFTAYNVEAEIDESISTITVSLRDGVAEGNIIVMAHAGGNTILKPLFFTFGEAVIEDPVYNGSTADIVLEGEMTQFDVKVSASIDYEVTVEEAASKWLIYNSTRAMTTLTHTFTADYYEDASGAIRTGEIRFSNKLYDVSAAIRVRQSPKIPEGNEGGISTAVDLVSFAAAVNAGASTARWENEAGEVVLLNDIDMSAVESWTPIGGIDASGYNTTTPYTTVNPFKGTFDGKGFAIKNMTYTADMSTGKWGYALFGSIEGATIRNLTLGEAGTDITWTFTGDAPKATCVATLAAYALNSTVEACTNYYNVDFTGECGAGVFCVASGFVGAMKNSTLGGRAKSLGCLNYGFVRTGKISNNESGGNGMQTAGICGFMAKDEGNLVQYCVNYGHISCPTGRTGGLVGTLMNGSVKNSDNRGLIEDDLAGKFEGSMAQNAYGNKRMGGLIGGTDDLKTTLTATVESCTNYGNVFTHIGARTGGFIGHSNIQVIGCMNQGAILGDVYNTDHGPAWACGYSGNSTATWTNVRSCTMGGYVGSYTTYKDNPASAPAATAQNAFSYKNDEYYDPSINN
ncbi:PL29 family lyase N-terminal domain-containing protein [uncultured Alistipes sp.]|uniref:PL29 family lyase N-terminal domain-containing protein n=1 Tax=uncultured Alistipes sp. TaxID=538949 RepID=UPI00260081E1|nr:PL29 family lyase N-terminal domain-containing protein [uncultured Alistipes sp.]